MPDVQVTQWYGNNPVGVTTTITPEANWGLLGLIFMLVGAAIGGSIPFLWVSEGGGGWDFAAVVFGALSFGSIGILAFLHIEVLLAIIVLVVLLYYGLPALFSEPKKNEHDATSQSAFMKELQGQWIEVSAEVPATIYIFMPDAILVYEGSRVGSTPTRYEGKGPVITTHFSYDRKGSIEIVDNQTLKLVKPDGTKMVLKRFVNASQLNRSKIDAQSSSK